MYVVYGNIVLVMCTFCIAHDAYRGVGENYSRDVVIIELGVGFVVENAMREFTAGSNGH